MPFGKRPAMTTGYRSILPVEPTDSDPMAKVPLALAPSVATSLSTDPESDDDWRDDKPTAQRLIDFSETMFQLFGKTAELADAIRNGETIELSGWDVVLQPDVAPIDIRALDGYFTFAENGQTVHPTYGYALPGSPNQPDDSAQQHLHELTSRIIELNGFCQRAAQDDALGVALQLPALPELVDRILVGAAHFTAYFENLALIKAQASSGPMTIDYAPLLQTVERRRLLATEKMLAPDKVEAYAPFGPWPYIGIETLTRPLTGQRFHNKIFFPPNKLPPSVPIVVRMPESVVGA